MSLTPDLEICKSITRRGGSNLMHASKALSKPRQALFYPCYASMRLIDDWIDDHFLTLMTQEREDKRSLYLKILADWEKLTCAAVGAQNSIEDLEQLFQNQNTDLIRLFPEVREIFPPILRMLQHTAGQSDMGPLPWHYMAEAMRRDVNEENITDWADFSTYAKGATVSPTMVYLYVLICEHDKVTDHYHSKITSAILMERATSLGEFCYLVHIARDLVKDCQTGGQILTLPVAIRNQLKKYQPEDRQFRDVALHVIHEILDQIQIRYDQMLQDRNWCAARMSLKNKLVFKGLLGLYMKMYDKLRENPLSAFDQNFEKQMRQTSQDFMKLQDEKIS